MYHLSAKSTLLPTCKPKPVTRKRTSLKKPKPKITLLGSFIAINSGPIIAANSANKDTCVYSVSGLSLDKESVIASALESKQIVETCSLDLAKGFGTISHHILLTKLKL